MRYEEVRSLILSIIRFGTVRLMSKKISDISNAKIDKCLFGRYSIKSVEYLFYHPTEQKIFVSRHATFMKKVYPIRGQWEKN